MVDDQVGNADMTSHRSGRHLQHKLYRQHGKSRSRDSGATLL
jgi:hypothetical protein